MSTKFKGVMEMEDTADTKSTVYLKPREDLTIEGMIRLSLANVQQYIYRDQSTKCCKF